MAEKQRISFKQALGMHKVLLGFTIVFFVFAGLATLSMIISITYGSPLTERAVYKVARKAIGEQGNFLPKNYKDLTKSLESASVEAFIDESATPNQISATQKEISRYPEVKSVKYISKEKAMKRLREDLKGNNDVLKELKDNPLPASFDIKVKKGESTKVINKINSNIQAKKVINDIRSPEFSNGVLDKLALMTRLAIMVIFAPFIAIFSIVFLILLIILVVKARRDKTIEPVIP